MNAVHNSILSPSFAPILDAAEARFTADQAEKESQRLAEHQAKQTALHAEREEVREWLATQIPPEFVPYIDLSDYTHRQAESAIISPHTGVTGCGLQLNIPGAAPIRFHIVRRRADNIFEDIYELFFAWYHGREGQKMRFGVPHTVEIEDISDGDGDFQLSWKFANRYEYSDFNLALGAAVALWREQGEQLMHELQAIRDQKDDELIEDMFKYSPLDNMADDLFLDDTTIKPISEIEALIERWVIEGSTVALRKKRAKLDSKIAKFLAKLEKVDNDLAATFQTLFENEIEDIIYACFLSGLSYGLSPCPTQTIEDHIVEVVAPIEKGTYIQWIALETRIRQTSPRLEAAYRSLDMLIAQHKGIEQDAMFLHGMAVGQRIISGVSRREEI